jgi:hypothetical protein
MIFEEVVKGVLVKVEDPVSALYRRRLVVIFSVIVALSRQHHYIWEVLVEEVSDLLRYIEEGLVVGSLE